MGATQLLARQVMENSGYDLLPPPVMATAKEMMLDAAAVALAAAPQGCGGPEPEGTAGYRSNTSRSNTSRTLTAKVSGR